MQQHRNTPSASGLRIDWATLLQRYANLLVQIGVAGTVLCLAYFLYAIYGGGLQYTDPNRAVSLLSFFGTVLIISAAGAAIGVAILTLDDLGYMVLVAVAGIGFMFGIPYLVASNLTMTVDQNVAQTISMSGTRSGMFMLFVVGLRILFDIFIQIHDAPARRQMKLQRAIAEDIGALKKQKSNLPANVFSPCWELPFCHEHVRELCPAYKAKRTCWQYGLGCNCDPKMIENLIRLGSLGTGKTSSEMRERQGAYLRSDLEADIQSPNKANKTISCSRCPIFTEHQRLKYKFINPVAVVGTIVFMGIMYKPIIGLWDTVISFIVQLASAISLGGPINAGIWFEYLQDNVVKGSVFFIFVLFVLSYLLKFTEWAILDKKKL